MYGDGYRLFTVHELAGPEMWLRKLPPHRRERHNRWVDAVAEIQSMLPENWAPYFEATHLPYQILGERDRDRLPRCSAFVHNLPELPEYELDQIQ